MSGFITVIEVGPRDGLQNEPATLSTRIKIELIERLAQCGLPVVEAGSFVSPKWVPQMADSDAVLSGVKQLSGTRYPVLVPNLEGLERAMRAGAKEVSVFTAASESFSLRNTNCSISASLERTKRVLEQAKTAGVRVRGYISCVLGCPYEGEIKASVVAGLAEQLLQLGCAEVSLGDTLGVGTPARANALIKTVAVLVPIKQLAVHFHDTYGQALANILACLDAGVRNIDTAVAGLGGCPYASGASGNVASEDVVYMLHGMGLETGIDLHALASVGNWISSHLQHPNNSRAGAALLAQTLEPHND